MLSKNCYHCENPQFDMHQTEGVEFSTKLHYGQNQASYYFVYLTTLLKRTLCNAEWFNTSRTLKWNKYVCSHSML